MFYNYANNPTFKFLKKDMNHLGNFTQVTRKKFQRQTQTIEPLIITEEQTPEEQYEVDDKIMFNLDWVRVYIPVNEKIYFETPMQQKIGGVVPLFFQGESWPEHDGYPLEFICQFLDPRPDHKDQFVRLFTKNVEDFDDSNKDHVYLSKICLKDKQIIQLPIPNNLYFTKPYLITSWIHDYDLSIENIPEEFEDTISNFFVQNCQGIKIQGIGNSTQGVEYDYFIQNVFAYYFGDSGSIHIHEDGSAIGDMC